MIGRRWPVGSTWRPVGLSPRRPSRIGWRLAPESRRLKHRHSGTSAGRSSTHRATLLPVWHHNSNFRTGAAFLGIGREYFDFREEAFSQQPKLSAHLTLARYEKIHANPLLKGLRVLQDPGRVTLSFDRICIFEGEHSVLWLASRIETM